MSAWNLRAENDQVATPAERVMAVKMVVKTPHIADRAAAYAMPGCTVDGNDVMAVHEAASSAVANAFNSAAERIEGITKKLNQSLGNGVAIG